MGGEALLTLFSLIGSWRHEPRLWLFSVRFPVRDSAWTLSASLYNFSRTLKILAYGRLVLAKFQLVQLQISLSVRQIFQAQKCSQYDKVFQFFSGNIKLESILFRVLHLSIYDKGFQPQMLSILSLRLNDSTIYPIGPK